MNRHLFLTTGFGFVAKSALMGALLLVAGHASAATECSDGIDNDGNGKIDALVEFWDPSATLELGNGDPLSMTDMVNASAAMYGYPTLPAGVAFHNDSDTSTMLCNIAGYMMSAGRQCSAPTQGNLCGFASMTGNQMYKWDVNQRKFVTTTSNIWISSVTCSGLSAACGDGKDNDGDGTTDKETAIGSRDVGCASWQDVSEIQHDDWCEGLDDTTERAPRCSDGKDNDGDGKIDESHDPNGGDPGCTAWDDDDEADGVGQGNLCGNDVVDPGEECDDDSPGCVNCVIGNCPIMGQSVMCINDDACPGGYESTTGLCASGTCCMKSGVAPPTPPDVMCDLDQSSCINVPGATSCEDGVCMRGPNDPIVGSNCHCAEQCPVGFGLCGNGATAQCPNGQHIVWSNAGTLCGPGAGGRCYTCAPDDDDDDDGEPLLCEQETCTTTSDCSGGMVCDPDVNDPTIDGCWFEASVNSCVKKCLMPSCVNNVCEMRPPAGTPTSPFVPCSATQCPAARCGDGIVQAQPDGSGEQCDDRNTLADDGCDATCKKEICGDSVVQPKGADGLSNTTDDEQCDDGNRVVGDGCDNHCKEEECGNGTIDSGEQCDDGVGNSDTAPNACRMDCILPICNDGVLDQNEQCECGAGLSPTAACNVTVQGKPASCTACRTSYCGDGIQDNAGIDGETGTADDEMCDDGPLNNNQPIGGNNPSDCRTNCKVARCGDGIVDVEAGEICDQGAAMFQCDGGSQAACSCGIPSWGSATRPSGGAFDSTCCAGGALCVNQGIGSCPSNCGVADDTPNQCNNGRIESAEECDITSAAKLFVFRPNRDGRKLPFIEDNGRWGVVPVSIEKKYTTVDHAPTLRVSPDNAFLRSKKQGTAVTYFHLWDVVVSAGNATSIVGRAGIDFSGLGTDWRVMEVPLQSIDGNPISFTDLNSAILVVEGNETTYELSLALYHTSGRQLTTKGSIQSPILLSGITNIDVDALEVIVRADSTTDTSSCVSCLIKRCGNGVIEAVLGETCDDNNAEGGDGCSDRCEVEICAVDTDTQSSSAGTISSAARSSAVSSAGLVCSSFSSVDMVTGLFRPVIANGPGGKLWHTVATQLVQLPGGGTTSRHNRIGMVDANGVSTVLTLSSTGEYPIITSMALGPDGNMWFTSGTNFQDDTDAVGYISPQGAITWVRLPTAISQFGGGYKVVAKHITAGPDGNMWVSADIGDVFVLDESTMLAQLGGAIGSSSALFRIAPDGTAVKLPGMNDFKPSELAGTDFSDIAAGPDGNVWFTIMAGNRIYGYVGKVTPQGVFSFYHKSSGSPNTITRGEDGNMWFSEEGKSTISKITPTGTITTYQTSGTTIVDVLGGEDGRIWFLNMNGFGVMTTAGVVQKQDFPALTNPNMLATGPDGLPWFSAQTRVGRFSCGG